MSTLTPNYNLKKPEATDPFKNFRQDYNSNLDIIDLNLGGGGGSGGHTIIDTNGSDMPQESGLQFTGGVSVSDDSVNGKTVVNITGGSTIYEYMPTCFDLNEREVGCFVDGKPVYQKTIEIPALPNTGALTVNHNISNFEKLVDAKGIFWASTWGGTIPFLSMSGASVSNAGAISFSASATTITVNAGSNRSGCVGYITLLYTKTTDSAGSGVWTPSGVPSVHYSTSEQVVGTWIDGKPVYQKTVDFGTFPANNGSKLVPHGISDIERLVNANFVCQSSTQFRTLPNVARSTASNQTLWYMTATEVGVLTGSNADVGSTYYGYITLQYTKTTD